MLLGVRLGCKRDFECGDVAEVQVRTEAGGGVPRRIVPLARVPAQILFSKSDRDVARLPPGRRQTREKAQPGDRSRTKPPGRECPWQSPPCAIRSVSLSTAASMSLPAPVSDTGGAACRCVDEWYTLRTPAFRGNSSGRYSWNQPHSKPRRSCPARASCLAAAMNVG